MTLRVALVLFCGKGVFLRTVFGGLGASKGMYNNFLVDIESVICFWVSYHVAVSVSDFSCDPYRCTDFKKLDFRSKLSFLEVFR